MGSQCPCGAWRGELGSEPHPGWFIEHLLTIFDEVGRVLRKDGLCFVNLGDSYSGSGKGPTGANGIGDQGQRQGFTGDQRTGGGLQRGARHLGRIGTIAGLPAKNLLLMPERFAIGMQDRGWTVRSRICWAKTSAMPESVHGSYYTKHRVKIGEYERLLRLRIDARRGPVSSSQSPLQAVSNGMVSSVPTDGGIPTSQSAVSGKREGARNGANPRGTPGCPGEAAHSQQFSAGANQQGEVRGDREGSGDPIQSNQEILIVGTRQGSATEAGRTPQIQPSVAGKEEGLRTPVPEDGGREGRSRSGDTSTASGHRGDNGRTTDGSRMAGDPEGESLPLLLLQREDETVYGSCDPAKQGRGAPQGERRAGVHPLQQSQERPTDDALVDCPGCARCEPHGGLILKKGSGRPTSAWEHIWLFSKSSDYFWDDTAVKTETGASLRNFWLLGPEPNRDAHYASFPSAIPRIAISAGTSEKGACPACGAPWVRVVERVKGREVDGPKASAMLAEGVRTAGYNGTRGSTLGIGGHAGAGWREHGSASVTTGWRPSCQCPPAEPVPCVVLDPFLGSGTTALVADRLGRSAIGIELNPEYAEMARRRLDSDAPLWSEPVEVVPAGAYALSLFDELEGALIERGGVAGATP